MHKQTIKELNEIKEKYILSAQLNIQAQNINKTQSSSNENEEILRLKQELEKKEKENNQAQESFKNIEEEFKVKAQEQENYLVTVTRNLENLKKSAESEIKLKDNKLKNLEKELENLKNAYKNTEKNLEIIENYKTEIEILTQNNELLQEQIKNHENKRLSILLEQDTGSNHTVEEFVNVILENFRVSGEERHKIEVNLCELLIKHKTIFQVKAR